MSVTDRCAICGGGMSGRPRREGRGLARWYVRGDGRKVCWIHFRKALEVPTYPELLEAFALGEQRYRERGIQ